MVTPSEVLNVDDDADEAAIRRAYRERIKEAHPDQGGSMEEFQLVRRAYRLLKKRARNGADIDADVDLTDDADATVEVGPATVEYLDYEVVADRGWDLYDDDLFGKAAIADLPPEAYGRLLVEPEETLLEAAENRGFVWPFSCRGGACANCAVFLVEGELSQPVNHIMPDELSDTGFRLSCNGYPASTELKVVFNVKHLPELDDLILPPGPFAWAHSE